MLPSPLNHISKPNLMNTITTKNETTFPPMNTPLLPPIAAPPPPSSTPHSLSLSLPNLGIGYAIAIALGFLLLLSTLLLCCRQRRHSSASVILPRIIFVAEDDEENPSGVVGLHQSVINSYPKFPFSKPPNSDPNSNLCSICLSDYKQGEMVRMMPDCKHSFHILCLDAWLRINASCPVCRSSPLPTPLSTPLAEVVPLSQYADDRRRRL